MKNELIARMEAFGADRIVGPRFKVSYRQTKGSLKTDWEAACHEAKVTKQIIEKHTAIAPGFRRFLFTLTSEKKQ